MSKSLLSLAITAIALSGCSLIPDYQRPDAPVAAQFPQGPAYSPKEAANVAAAEQGWRQFFHDPALQQLVQVALENNRDLKVAALNIDAYAAQYQIQRADLFPAISANVSGQRQRLPARVSGTGDDRISGQHSATVGISAYELDLFGRVRSLSEQALQNYFSTEEARRSTQISLVAETAQAWLNLAADLERQQLARQTLDSRRASLALDERRHGLGAISGLALAQSRTQAESARLDVAAYASQVEQDRHALELLLGTALPAELAPEAGKPLAEASRLVELPAGVPSELLQRRPDVLQAEHQLRASVANIGVARAAQFPRISLTAAAGTASEQLSGLFKAGSGSWSFGPSLSLPLFDGGANAAAVDSARLDRDIALAQYDKAVQTAFREVADALAVRAALAERLAAQQAVLASAERQLALAEAQYRTGSTGQLELLDARRTLYAAQQALIALRLTEQGNRLALYKVLGGGWQA